MFVELLEFQKSSFSIFPVLKELNKLLNPPVASKSNSEDTNKIVKLPWIPITGRQLRKTFKKKNYIYIKLRFKIVIMPKQDQVVT